MKKFFLLLMQFILTMKRNRAIKRLLSKDMTLIADFGCGHFPNKYANVLLDRIDSQDEQRGGLEIRKCDSLTFHNLDLNVFPYPFPDKHFDFIICSHVLEHLEDPVRACGEFSRIAKAGYIEVPYYCVDLFIRNNDVIHKWLCGFNAWNGSLSFVNRKTFLGCMQPRPISLFQRFILQFENVSLAWNGEVHAHYLCDDFPVDFHSLEMAGGPSES